MNNFNIKKYSLLLSVYFLFAFPASTNYQLKSFDFGGGGDKDLTSTNYLLEGQLGELNGIGLGSSNYQAGAGLFFVQQTNTPGKPTLQNNGSSYNKLRFILNTSSNPTDTTYSIAISSDNFVTTQYVQSDNTISSTLGIEDYQTYAAWGGATGEDVIGLPRSTTYKIKVNARQGKYSEGPYGPVSDPIATSDVSLTFDIDIGSTDPGETETPYTVALGSLAQGSVTAATNKIWIDFSTNADYGGTVFIYDQYGGLRSATAAYTITAVTGSLASSNEGFGIQGDAKSQVSGGPLVFQSPYDQTGDTVGIISTTVRELLGTSNSSVVSGRASFTLKAKSSTLTPASSDYTDTLTLIATGSF